MEFDDGEMVVVRHEYDEVFKDRVDRQSDAFYAIRDPGSYDLSDADPLLWNSDAFRIVGEVYIHNENDIAGYRKLLDAIEARIIERKASNDGV